MLKNRSHELNTKKQKTNIKLELPLESVSCYKDKLSSLQSTVTENFFTESTKIPKTPRSPKGSKKRRNFIPAPKSRPVEYHEKDPFKIFINYGKIEEDIDLEWRMFNGLKRERKAK